MSLSACCIHFQFKQSEYPFTSWVAGIIFDIMPICIIYLLPSLTEEASLSHSSFSAGSSRWFSGLRKQKTNWFGHHTGSVPKPSHRSGPSPSASCSFSTGASPSFSCPLRIPQKDNARVELVFYFTCSLCYLKLKFKLFFWGLAQKSTGLMVINRESINATTTVAHTKQKANV